MPPKKSQSKDNKTQKKCNFNNREYCKSKKECSKDQSDVVCHVMIQSVMKQTLSKEILINANMECIVNLTRKMNVYILMYLWHLTIIILKLQTKLLTKIEQIRKLISQYAKRVSWEKFPYQCLMRGN